MIKDYLDKSVLANPLLGYLRWLGYKVYYQLKNWGKHLRINQGAVVRKTVFGRYNWIGNNNTVLNCVLGDHTYIAGDCLIMNSKIGKYCSIARNVTIAPGTHPTSVFVSTHPSTFSRPNFHARQYIRTNMFPYHNSVEIGNDVWIGTNAVIVDGIIIGDGAVIGANAVVTKNVNDYEIVGGIPAQPVRKRFSEDKIKKLKEIKWWDKNEQWIAANISKFWSVDKFIEE